LIVFGNQTSPHVEVTVRITFGVKKYQLFRICNPEVDARRIFNPVLSDLAGTRYKRRASGATDEFSSPGRNVRYERNYLNYQLKYIINTYWSWDGYRLPAAGMANPTTSESHFPYSESPERDSEEKR
jgi:hypothetical protein